MDKLNLLATPYIKDGPRRAVWLAWLGYQLSRKASLSWSSSRTGAHAFAIPQTLSPKGNRIASNYNQSLSETKLMYKGVELEIVDSQLNPSDGFDMF